MSNDVRRYSHTQFMPTDFLFKMEISHSRKSGRLHSHDYFQMCYVLKGECTHSVNGREAVMVKGDFFALPPYLEHNTYAGEDRGNELVLIDFMPSLINQHMDDWGNMESFVDFAYIQPLVAVNEQLLPKLCLSLSGQVLVEQLIFDMEKEMNQMLDGYRLAVKAHLLRLLVIIGREYKQFLQGRHGEQVIAKYRKVFYEIFQFMDEHFHEELSLERMSNKANMTPTYFSAMFKMVKGKNFIEHLNELRIRKSMDLLINSDTNVMDISLMVGFNHLGHFNRTFKKIVGATPSHYRKMANR